MAFTKKPVVDNAAEEAAEMMAPPTAPKKKKGKMPLPGASKPGWQKIAAQMMGKQAK